MTALFILTRAIHIGACLLFFSIFAFDRFAAVVLGGQSTIAVYWHSRIRWFSLALAPVILISGIAWFAFVAMSMSGESLQLEILKTVWMRTEFGIVSRARLIFWLAVAAMSLLGSFKLPSAPQKRLMALQLVLSGCLLGSLAWCGHGRESSPWHLFADILHLLAAGFWPAGLLPLVLLLNKLRETSLPEDWTSTAALVRRFSAISLGCVALLAATGFVNSWYLVGSFSNLVSQPYGRWLSAKIILYFIAGAIGAVNLLRLKPRLLNTNSQLQPGNDLVAQLRRNVLFEIFLGTVIVVIVAILGILPP